MTTDTAPTKSALVALLRSSGAYLLDTLRPLPPERFEEGRYESGWNGRQILAHVASIEWTYPRLLEIATQGASGSTTAEGLPTRAARGGIDAYNDRQVQKRADSSVADLLSEFEQNRARTIAAVQAVDDARLAMPIRSAGGVTGPLGLVIQRVAVDHIRGHTQDIVGQ